MVQVRSRYHFQLEKVNRNKKNIKYFGKYFNEDDKWIKFAFSENIKTRIITFIEPIPSPEGDFKENIINIINIIKVKAIKLKL